MTLSATRIKTGIFETQNSLFRCSLQTKFPARGDFRMKFLGNKYSGYWFPDSLIQAKGSIWGVGLGFDSSFEYELLGLGYSFSGFEPEKNCFNASIVQFEGTQAEIENYGLWDRSGYFNFTGENISIVNIFRLDEVNEVKLEIRSLWDVAVAKNLNRLPHPRVLKLNIEGAEREILLKFLHEPLDFDVIIFQAEFLFHVGFWRISEKWKSYQDLRNILRGFQEMGWIIIDFSRHQITLLKSKLDKAE